MNANLLRYYGEEESGWRVRRAPALDPRLVSELTGAGGSDLSGRPNLIFEWGGTRPSHLKPTDPWPHFLCRIKRKVNEVLLPSGVAVPVYDTYELGKPRWFVHRLEHGVYRPYFEVETNRGEYKHPDAQTIEWVRESLYYKEEKQQKVDELIREMLAEDQRPAEVIRYNPTAPAPPIPL